MPRKVRQLVRDLLDAGFRIVPGGKGSHRKILHPRLNRTVIMSGKDGDDAQAYQEKLIRRALNDIQ